MQPTPPPHLSESRRGGTTGLSSGPPRSRFWPGTISVPPEGALRTLPSRGGVLDLSEGIPSSSRRSVSPLAPSSRAAPRLRARAPGRASRAVIASASAVPNSAAPRRAGPYLTVLIWFY